VDFREKGFYSSYYLITALRGEYVVGNPDMFPLLKHICQQHGFEDDCITQLFGDPVIAWRIAGLPKPTMDMSAFMSSSDLV
jgi:hypothetical protein